MDSEMHYLHRFRRVLLLVIMVVMVHRVLLLMSSSRWQSWVAGIILINR